ncbi:TetR/AcrR family transcriptional regulator [Limosilactobacillus albertensis]|uniref:TetR/AcrR family transcriptional regulator n=1 Tax=Limosilactobacillus albertensis TaxID=2759752 RepID=A0A839H2L3_9LACO|nr:TetR/AcrR family transcriptional regulator [Limosilactobacillus albertensis]MBB1124141.1 TetR/AcrR family transcriptional regulator [Limosilactobacillus albertensis]MCD7122069.1 TetR/AcrR family transcriptional regulator [Limosilactobacillus albertensis]
MQQHQKFLQTEEKVKDAVVQLIKKKGLANITVSDIVSQAAINRTTFYRHYLDKYDLIEHYRAAILDAFQELSEQYLSSILIWQDPYSAKMQGNDLLKRAAENFTANHNFYRVWFSEEGDPQTVKLISQLINDSINKRLSQLVQDNQVKLMVPLTFAREIIISGLWSIIKVWLVQEQAISANELYNILLRTRYLSPFELVGLRRNY